MNYEQRLQQLFDKVKLKLQFNSHFTPLFLVSFRSKTPVNLAYCNLSPFNHWHCQRPLNWRPLFCSKPHSMQQYGTCRPNSWWGCPFLEKGVDLLKSRRVFRFRFIKASISGTPVLSFCFTPIYPTWWPSMEILSPLEDKIRL